MKMLGGLDTDVVAIEGLANPAAQSMHLRQRKQAKRERHSQWFASSPGSELIEA